MKLNRAEVGGSSGWFGQPFVDSAIRLALLSVLALAFAHGGAVAKGPQPALEPTHFDSRYRLELLHPVQDKNFYLFSLLQRERALRLAIQQDDTLQRLAGERRSAQKKALACSDVACVVGLHRLDPSTVQAVSGRLRQLSQKPAFAAFVRRMLRPSGAFVRYDALPDAELLIAAWSDAAGGINRILSVYGLGEEPRYGDIDRAGPALRRQDAVDSLKSRLAVLDREADPLFFEPALGLAMALLELHQRDEAGRYEPLELGENRAAVAELKRIDWIRQPHPFILVLGAGAADAATALSPVGAQRADVAARLFKLGRAPMIIVSGGHVHPMQTPFCEAIEMKRYLMRAHGIAAERILVEPHARHTTTNFRNAARLVFRLGIPTNRPALVTSSAGHVAYAADEVFRARSMNELGYSPVRSIRQLSPTEAEFTPSVASLFFDARDPLDP